MMKGRFVAKIPVLGLAAAALMAASLAFAQWQYDASQLALLPPYCKYTQLYRTAAPGGNDPAEIQRWSELMGGAENFAHMHHYCWALENTNRGLYSSKSKLERDRYLTATLGDLDYVLQRVAPSFVLLPEILTKKGENLIRLGRGPEAMDDLLRAIQLKPDYWPPYAVLSDYFRDRKDVVNAKDWLNKGLAAAPNARPLETRLRQLNSMKPGK
jgi:tetratricopeptide (TPR) repeat protein